MKLKLRTLFASGLIFSLGIFLGRVTGLAREMILAKLVGVNAQADIAVLILTLPDLMINFLIGGALATAFLPHIYEVPKEHRFSFFLKLTGTVAIASIVVMAIAYLLSRPLTLLLAPGLSAEHLLTAENVLKLTLLAVPLIAMASVSRCFLQSENRFGLISFENASFNLVVTGGLLLLSGVIVSNGNWLIPLAGTVVLGALLRWLPQFFQSCWSLSKSSKQKSISPKVPFEVWKRYLQALGAGLIIVSFPYIARSISSLSGDGALATFNYAFKIVELPVAVGVTAFSTVLFPRIAQAFQAGISQVEALIKVSWHAVLIFTIPATLSLSWWLYFLNPTDFIQLGALTSNNIYHISLLAALGTLALPARGLWQLNLTIMSAKKDTITPLWISIFGVISCVPTTYWAHQIWGIQGVFGAMVGISYGIMFVSFWLLNKKHHLKIFDSQLLLTTGASLIPAILSLLVVSKLSAVLAQPLSVETWLLNQSVRLLLAIIAGLTAVLAGTLATPEFRSKLFR